MKSIFTAFCIGISSVASLHAAIFTVDYTSSNSADFRTIQAAINAALVVPSITKLSTSPDLTLAFRVPAGGGVGTGGNYRSSELRYTLLQNPSLGTWDPTPASWITGWTLTEADNGAARLQLQVTPEGSPKRFFTLRGDK